MLMLLAVSSSSLFCSFFLWADILYASDRKNEISYVKFAYVNFIHEIDYHFCLEAPFSGVNKIFWGSTIKNLYSLGFDTVTYPRRKL